MSLKPGWMLNMALSWARDYNIPPTRILRADWKRPCPIANQIIQGRTKATTAASARQGLGIAAPYSNKLGSGLA